jgi:hypothetical protein
MRHRIGLDNMISSGTALLGAVAVLLVSSCPVFPSTCLCDRARTSLEEMELQKNRLTNEDSTGHDLISRPFLGIFTA